MIHCVLTLLGLFLATDLIASDLRPPFDQESAQVLPEKVRNPRFKLIQMWMEDKYNGVGEPEPLGRSLNKTVAWSDVLGGLSAQDQVLFRSKINDAGVPYSGNAGSTTGQVNGYARVFVPAMAIGVTPRWTLAVALPIYTVDIKADTGFVRSRDGQTVINEIASSSPMTAESAALKLNDAVNSSLRSKGYQEIRSVKKTAIGDVKLISKLLLYKDRDQSVALKNDLSTPTGKTADPDKLVDVSTGEGQFSTGIGGVYDRTLSGLHPLLRWISGVNYTYQLPDQMEKHLPASATDSLSADKELVNRKRGDLMGVSSGLNFGVPVIACSLGAQYNLQYAQRTTYSGSKYASERYEWLGNGSPSQTLHSATYTLGFSTIDWYRAKRFVLPMQAVVSLAQPLAGRNAPMNNIYSADLVLFF